jgi:ketosteroid isomerase-like protein
MDDRDELHEASDAWDGAVIDRDVEAASALLDDNYELVLIQPDVQRVPRDAWLRMLPGYVVHSWDTEAQLIDIDGDVGTVLTRLRMSATVLGEDRSGVFITSDIWRRSEGAWRVWRRHSTPMSAGDLASESDTV